MDNYINDSMYAGFMQRLRCLFATDRIYDMEGVIFADGLKKQLIYPTNDMILFREQFDAIMKILAEGESMYILSDGYNSSLKAPQKTRTGAFFSVMELGSSPDFDVYARTTRSDMFILFPDSFRWVMVISEIFGGGLAVIAGDDDIIDKFADGYPYAMRDLIAYTEYCIDLYRNESINFDALKTILNILK